MLSAIMVAWMETATELAEGFADLSEAGIRIFGDGEPVSDERLAGLRHRNKASVARLKAAVAAQKEQDHGEVPETPE